MPTHRGRDFDHGTHGQGYAQQRRNPPIGKIAIAHYAKSPLARARCI